MISAARLGLIAGFACAWLGACNLERTIGLSTNPAQVRFVERALRFTGRDRVDILLVIDDSGSMSAKQELFREQLPGFVKSIVQANVNRSVRVGVITSDLGAPGISCGQNRGGKLQGVGAGAIAGCSPPVGASWLMASSAGVNLPDGQTLDQTLTCMTSVGDKGCGFEMQLEAARRQLTDPPPAGEAFMRQDALLLVVFLTDEDDCSVAQGSDLFTANPAYGPLNSYRCTRYGIVCDGALPSDAPMSYGACRPASADDGGKLIDVAAYTTLFTQPKSLGGLKDDPRDVLLAAIDAPANPVATQQVNGADLCGSGVATCTNLFHSCLSSVDDAVFADPPVRLDAVVRAAGGLSRSICEASYQPFANELAARVEAAANGNACVPGALADRGNADCTVKFDGADVPRCVGVLGSARCWLVEPDERCPLQIDPRDGSSQQLRMRVIGADMSRLVASCSVLSAQ